AEQVAAAIAQNRGGHQDHVHPENVELAGAGEDSYGEHQGVAGEEKSNQKARLGEDDDKQDQIGRPALQELEQLPGVREGLEKLEERLHSSQCIIAGLTAENAIRGLYPIIDTAACSKAGVDPEELARAIARTSITVAQFRHKGPFTREVFEQA